MKWKFGEFSKFRESDKSLGHELGSILKILSSHVSCFPYGSFLFLTNEMVGSNPFTVMKNSIVTELCEFNENK